MRTKQMKHFCHEQWSSQTKDTHSPKTSPRLNTKYQPVLNLQTTQALLSFYLLLVIMQQLVQGNHVLFFPFPQQSHILSLKSGLLVSLQIISKYPHHAHPLSHASWFLEHERRNWNAEEMMQRHPSPRGSSASELSPAQGLCAAGWHWLRDLCRMLCCMAKSFGTPGNYCYELSLEMLIL